MREPVIFHARSMNTKYNQHDTAARLVTIDSMLGLRGFRVRNQGSRQLKIYQTNANANQMSIDQIESGIYIYIYILCSV